MKNALTPKNPDTKQTPQERLLKLIEFAIYNPGSGVEINIKGDDVKIKGREGDDMFMAEMKNVGSTTVVTKHTTPHRKKGDKKIIDDAKALRDAGKTQEEIADILGRTQPAISGYLKE